MSFLEACSYVVNRMVDLRRLNHILDFIEYGCFIVLMSV